MKADQKAIPARRARTVAGFLLLEALLALVVFGLAALALVTALQDTALAADEARAEQEAIDMLQSILDEYSKAPQIRAGVENIEEDASGIRYSVETALAYDLFDKNQIPLTNIYRMTVRAWLPNSLPGNKPDLEAETLRYALLYQN